ncbi:endonuclease V-domain-containing protein [Powellomyces hirtus]|nr:endonuclease V-domain-containing protein [Powellomyces hirtus]
MDPKAKAREWDKIQESLKLRITPHDQLNFTVPPQPVQNDHVRTAHMVGGCHKKGDDAAWQGLRYIAGMDVSFFEGTDEAVGCVVVMKVPGLMPVYTDCERVTLTTPYIPSYLAFREAPILLALLDKLQRERPEIYPQVLMIDGNGILHPRMCGLACHVGVSRDIPTIGVGKNFLQIDGEDLTMQKIKELSHTRLTGAGKWFPLTGTSGRVYGAALRSTDSINPIFVSPGHRVSVETAVEITAWCCKYRVPEPIRAADYASREVVRGTHRQKA